MGINKNSTDPVGQTLLTGGSGAAQIENGDGVCVVDLQGDPEVVKIIQIHCELYGLKMRHFTQQDLETSESARYDPLA